MPRSPSLPETNTTAAGPENISPSALTMWTSIVFCCVSAIGDLGILPRHAPLLSLLKAGELRVQTPDGAEQSFFVGGGVVEVQPQKVTVLADTAARAKDLDEAAALEAKQRAEEALQDKTGHIDQAHALAELARAAAQLKLIERLRKLRS